MNTLYSVDKRKVRLGFGVPVGLLFVLVVWGVVSGWSRVLALESNEVRHAAAIHAFTLTAAILLCCLAGVLVPIALLYRRLTMTTIGETEVVQPRLFGGVTRLTWSDVVRVQRDKKSVIHLHGQLGSVVIPVNFFQHPERLIAYISERVNRNVGFKP